METVVVVGLCFVAVILAPQSTNLCWLALGMVILATVVAVA